MQNIRPATPKGDQSCPICGAQLAAGALQCESCGTDLSKSGVLFGTQVRPATLPRHRRFSKLLKPAVLKPAAVVVVLAGLIGLGGVPAVSGRVPVLGSLYAHSVGLVLGKPAPAPVRQQEESSSFLLVRSTPPGAQVQVDDRDVGTTPLTVDLKPGTYRVLISRQGYPPVHRTVEVTEGPVSLVASLLTGEVESPSASRASRAAEPQATEPQAAQAPQAPQPSQRPQPKPITPAPPRPAPARPPLATGVKAPALALKDRLGVIHRLEVARGHKTAVLFIWRLDNQTRQVIRDLDARVRNSGGRVASLVVLMQPDRVALRTFITTWQLRIPLVIGTPQAATQYHVASGVNMLYLISERGIVEQAQKGTIHPASVIR